MGPGKIVQAFDINHRQGPVHRRLGVRRKKVARLGRMAVGPQRYVKSLFDGRRRAGHIQQQPVVMGNRKGKSVRADECRLLG